jgi:hypothetical protein
MVQNASRGSLPRDESHPYTRRNLNVYRHPELETKAGIPLDAVVTHGEMMRAFEVFKDANDEHPTLADKRAFNAP